MRKYASRSAFTLLEMTLAVALFSLVVAGSGAFVAGAYRLTKQTFARVSLSMQLRETRERLLFRSVPAHDGVVYAGILSGTNSNCVVEPANNPFKLLMTVGGMKSSDGSIVSPRSRNMQLFRDSGRFQNDDYRPGAAWLRPMGANVVPPGWLSAFDSLERSPRAIAVVLGGTVDGIGMTNRTVVPVYGTIQYYGNTTTRDSTRTLWGSDW